MTARRRSRWLGIPFLSGGLTLPKVRLDDFGGHVAIDKGLAKLQEIAGKSRDGEVALEGEVTLRDPLPTSTVNAYLRFKLSDAFLKQASAVATMLQMVGAQGKRPDGFYGMRLSGRLGQLNPPVLSPTSPIIGPPPPRPHAAITPAFRPPVPAPPPATARRPRRWSQRLPRPRRAEPAAPPPPPPPAPAPPAPPAPPAAATTASATPGAGGWHPPGPAVADGSPSGTAGAPAAPPPLPPPAADRPEQQESRAPTAVYRL